MLPIQSILKTAILCFLASSLTAKSFAGDNRSFPNGSVSNSTVCYATPNCRPVNKVNPVLCYGRSPAGIHPESPAQRPVELSYVEPGPIRAIAFYAVGLIKSTIASPFRLIETVIPAGSKTDCSRPRPMCGTPPVCQLQRCVPICKPAMAGCAPPAPNLGPRPGPPCQPSCWPNLSPQVVKEYEFPPVEPNNLLSGLWNLPATLFRQGQVTGDVFRNNSSVPICGVR